jgi:putative flippase GtrA
LLSDYRRQIRRELFRFLQVGLAGLAADALTLWLLIYVFGFGGTSFGLLWTRGASFVVAISVTFVLNAGYTFGTRLRDSNVLGYLAIQLLGAGINLGPYGALVLTGPLAHRPLYCLLVGSAVATLSNFVLVRRFVFNS